MINTRECLPMNNVLSIWRGGNEGHCLCKFTEFMEHLSNDNVCTLHYRQNTWESRPKSFYRKYFHLVCLWEILSWNLKRQNPMKWSNMKKKENQIAQKYVRAKETFLIFIWNQQKETEKSDTMLYGEKKSDEICVWNENKKCKLSFFSLRVCVRHQPTAWNYELWDGLRLLKQS